MPGRHSTWTQRQKGRRKEYGSGKSTSCIMSFHNHTPGKDTHSYSFSPFLSISTTYIHIKSLVINYIALLASRKTPNANQMLVRYNNHAGTVSALLNENTHCKTCKYTFQTIPKKIRGQMNGQGALRVIWYGGRDIRESY